jgi:hypothetical protein
MAAAGVEPFLSPPPPMREWDFSTFQLDGRSSLSKEWISSDVWSFFLQVVWIFLL